MQADGRDLVIMSWLTLKGFANELERTPLDGLVQCQGPVEEARQGIHAALDGRVVNVGSNVAFEE